MSDKDEKVWIVFNGEIYNFQELRAKLEKKYSFRGASDTEVILYAYREWGPKCVEKFNGMWAFCIYDTEKKRLFLSRDRHGKKPLYYYKDTKRFIFGSELKAILRHEVSVEVAKKAVDLFMTYGFVPEPESIFTSVKKVEPGTNVLVDLKSLSVKTERFWELDFSEKESVSGESARKLLRELIDDAVEKRLVADVEVGTFLSGGLDSSLVTASIVKARKELGTETHSFGVGFDRPEYDESKYSAKVAEFLGTNHHTVQVDKGRTIEIMNSLTEFFDEPFADSSMIPTYAVSELARKNVTVALSGDGGDETFGGYRTYVLFNLARKYYWSSLMLKTRGLLAAASGAARKLNKSGVALGLQKASLVSSRDEGVMFSQLMSACPPEAFKEENAVYAKHFRYKNWLDNALYASSKVYLPGDILHKVDRASMANSLEVRAPLLDYRISEFAARLPNEFKVQGNNTKVLLKACFSDRLPAEIIHRQKKGFSVPIAEYLLEALGGEVESSIESLAKRDWFTMDKAVLGRALEQHRRKRRDWSGFLYAAHMLEKWAKRWRD